MTLAQSYVGIDVARAHLDIFDERHGRAVRIPNHAQAIAGPARRRSRVATWPG